MAYSWYTKSRYTDSSGQPDYTFCYFLIYFQKIKSYEGGTLLLFVDFANILCRMYFRGGNKLYMFTNVLGCKIFKL